VPFVRFARDRRGYEHVYLVDVSKERGRSRVLYWFRTPPGVKVGRSPFDPETQRSLERQNPGVAFDWPQIVAARMPPPAPVENWREKRRVERAIKRARATEAGESDRVDVAEQTPPSEETELDPAPGELVPDELDIDVEPGEEVGARPADEGAAEPPSLQASTAGPDPPGRRRRRRRGRRSSSPPAEAHAGTSAQNGPLDPPPAAEKPSNEE
jgi:hypothetical protein